MTLNSFNKKMARAIRGSVNLLKHSLKELRYQIAMHADDNTKYVEPSSAGRFELPLFIDKINEIQIGEEYKKIHTVNKNKKKVCFVLNTYNYWNCYVSVCAAFDDDESYEVVLVLTERCYLKKVEMVENAGLKIVAENDYNILEEKPDIVFLTYQGSESIEAPSFFQYRQEIPLLIVLPGQLKSGIPDNYPWSGRLGYALYKPDYYFFDISFYEQMKKRRLVKDNMIPIHDGKYDGIYEALQKAQYPIKWSKLKDKRVVLWGNTHGIYNERISYTCTFDVYAKKIFEYAKMNEEIGFVIRLHPRFLEDMREYGYWNDRDFIRLRKFCDDSPNIVWDDNVNYNIAYSICDAVITDGFCGMVMSALPLGKPILACYRPDRSIRPCHEEYIKTLYQAHNTDELENFLNMVKEGRDDMYDIRKKSMEKYLGTFDGKNGVRIKELTETLYYRKCK